MQTRRKQRGLALVETAVVSPVILFLLLIAAEVTNAFVDHNTLTKAARDGARYVAGNALLGTTGVVNLSAPVILRTRNLVVYGNIAGFGSPHLPGLAIGNVQVQNAGNNNIRVTVTYAYSGILGNSLPAFGFGGDPSLALNLSATVTMRAL
jgi:hypothetical protein